MKTPTGLQILPDLALWEYRGTETVRGQAAGVWVLEQRCSLLLWQWGCCMHMRGCCAHQGYSGVVLHAVIVVL